jgi:hypothetical protein
VIIFSLYLTIFLFLKILDLVEMVCSDTTEANISIPVVMITKSAGEAFNASLSTGKKG